MFCLTNFKTLICDVINTFIENVLPKHFPGFWKTLFENINENNFSNISLNISGNIQNKCLLNVSRNNLVMFLFDVMNTFSENIVPKHYASFWKTSFGNIK